MLCVAEVAEWTWSPARPSAQVAVSPLSFPSLSRTSRHRIQVLGSKSKERLRRIVMPRFIRGFAVALGVLLLGFLITVIPPKTVLGQRPGPTTPVSIVQPLPVPITGSVSVTNTPLGVTGGVNVNNFPASQNVNGSVSLIGTSPREH